MMMMAEKREWRSLQNEELHTVMMIKSRLRWAGHVPRVEEGRTAFIILTGTLAEKRPLGRRKHRWEDNIRIDLKDIRINMKNWDYWRVLVNAALNLQVQ